MANAKGNILVVDDDEVVLVAIADLLEEDGYAVFTQQSPIGATQVIVRESIDLAVIDVNLPVMQGDNVVRLLQSWDRVKDLPIVIISGVAQDRIGALQAELPQTRFVPKAQMNHLLLSTVAELLRARDVRRHRATFTPGGGAVDDVDDLVARFGREVARTLGDAPSRFRGIAAGSKVDKLALSRSVANLRGQAQLLGLDAPAQLLGAFAMLLEAIEPGSRWPASVNHAVDDAIGALSSLQQSPRGEFAMSPDPVRRRLMQALSLLRLPKS
jgi:CheY-like chemotaxis protein